MWKLLSRVQNSLWPHGLYSSWNSPGQNTGVGSLSCLQEIFPSQGSNPGFLHCRQILNQVSHRRCIHISPLLPPLYVIRELSSLCYTPAPHHGSVSMSILILQFVPPSFPLPSVHKSFLYICASVPALKIANPLLGIYLEKTIIQKDTCTPVFTAALFTTARAWKQLKYPSTHEWIMKMWYLYTVEYYSAIKRNKIGSSILFKVQGNQSSEAVIYPEPWSLLAFQAVLVVKNAGDVRDVGSVLGLGRSPGGGHGNPLRYSCLENPMDRGAWWATVHKVAKSWDDWSDLACTHEGC